MSFHNHRATSHLGLLAGSNKELVVYDSNANKAVRVMQDGHFKHAHTVKWYEGSYNDHEALNTFYTASTDSTIKLWDLRVGGKSVRDFVGQGGAAGNGHTNRSM
jgi:WD40 repeat protein